MPEFCRIVSNLMRIWKDKPHRLLRCMLVSGAAFGLLHALNIIATGVVLAALIQVIYTAAIGVLNGTIYLRSRNIWGVILMHDTSFQDIAVTLEWWVLFAVLIVSNCQCVWEAASKCLIFYGRVI